ncbi:hypothetical protein Sjap_009985 [Stephania japonica]|uniref:Uncharacterized protein n=1 Tax=Stephania japonica TaxID=461633 RepID=A0AAP0JAV4_9MAGN
MESLKTLKANLLFHFFVVLSGWNSLLIAQAVAPVGTIERSTKQQILASIPPPGHEAIPPQLFLTSTAGAYSAFLLRRETSQGAGGFGSDFCYIQVQDHSGSSVWESECTPVSNVNTCTLVLSDAGFEIFDGSRSAWDSDVDVDEHVHLERLELMDTGDMQMRDNEGELSWKASDSPASNQNCGSVGAPGQAPAHPPFAAPIHSNKGPFGQPQPVNSQPQQPLAAPAQPTTHFYGSPLQPGPAGLPQQVGSNQPIPVPAADADQPLPGQPLSAGLNQPIGVLGNSQQPNLVDNTPFDSGSMRDKVEEVVVFQRGVIALREDVISSFKISRSAARARNLYLVISSEDLSEFPTFHLIELFSNTCLVFRCQLALSVAFPNRVCVQWRRPSGPLVRTGWIEQGGSFGPTVSIAS